MKFIELTILGLFLIFSACNNKQDAKIDALENKLQEQEQQLQQEKVKALEKELQQKDLQINRLNTKSNSITNTVSSSIAGIWPETSQRYLHYSDIANLNPYELKIMRNEIFARHGYIFNTKEMAQYFNQQSWYKPISRNVTSKLNSIEKSNIEFIKSYE